MFRVGLIVCCFCLLSVGVQAQAIKGRVMEDKTRIPLAGVRVDNLTSKQTTTSDNNGNFSIAAEVNQTLVFKVFSYDPDTVLITSRASLEVFLTLQSHTLKSVNVTTAQGPSTLKVYDPNFHGQTLAYQTDANGRPVGGVILRMWYWKKDEHRKKRLADQEKEEQIEKQIDEAFTPANLANYIPLKNAEMNRFIVLYRPSTTQWLSKDFNMLSYLDSCYKKYSQLSAADRVSIDSLIKVGQER